MIVIRVKRLRDAKFAYCEHCGVYIDYNGYWSLSSSIGLHKRGSCDAPRITLWGYRDA